MVTCSAYGCTNRSGQKNSKEDKLSFFIFPSKKDEERRKKWIAAVRRLNWTPNRHSFLCSIHFSSDQINFSYPSGPRLKEGSVPNLFPGFSKNLKSTLRKVRKERAPDPLQENQTFDPDQEVDVADNLKVDESPQDEETLSQVLAKNQLLSEEIVTLKEDLNRCRAIILEKDILIERLQQAKEKQKNNMSSFMTGLIKNSLISEEAKLSSVTFIM